MYQPRMVVLLSLMLLTINAVKSQELNVNVQYLHRNYHLSDSSITDHFFFCGVKGMTLQWEVNKAPLGGFTEGQAGTVLRNSRSNFNYSAVLLSSQRNLEYYSFSSILIISSARSHLLEVVCVSDVGYNVTNNNNMPLLLQQEMQQNRSDASGNVILQHLFSSGDMLNNTESIDMFICGVQEDFQSWEVNENGLPFGFSILDNEDRTIPSPALGRTSVTTLAFLTASEPYRLATFLLLVGHSNVNITCACGRYHVNLFIHDQQQIPTTTAQAYNDLTTSSKEYPKVSKEYSFTSEFSVANVATKDSSTHVKVVLPIVLTIVGILITIVLSLILVFVIHKVRIWRRTSNSPSRNVKCTPNRIPTSDPEKGFRKICEIQQKIDFGETSLECETQQKNDFEETSLDSCSPNIGTTNFPQSPSTISKIR